MHRFFFDETHRDNDRVRLDEAESKHAFQVLRLKKGAQIVLMDGLGGVYGAEVEDETKQRLIARITHRLPDNEAKTQVTLYQGLPKADKLEVILQKCTELGVHALQPVLFERCVREPGKNSDKELQRLRRIAREAAKQCGRGQVPMVGQAKSFADVEERIHRHDLILVPWEQARDTRIADVIGTTKPREVALVIGPEGGFAPEEI